MARFVIIIQITLTAQESNLYVSHKTLGCVYVMHKQILVSAKHESLHYRGSVLWNKIPSEIRKLPSLNVFKTSFHGKDFSNTP